MSVSCVVLIFLFFFFFYSSCFSSRVFCFGYCALQYHFVTLMSRLLVFVLLHDSQSNRKISYQKMQQYQSSSCSCCSSTLQSMTSSNTACSCCHPTRASAVRESHTVRRSSMPSSCECDACLVNGSVNSSCSCSSCQCTNCRSAACPYCRTETFGALLQVDEETGTEKSAVEPYGAYLDMQLPPLLRLKSAVVPPIEASAGRGAFTAPPPLLANPAAFSHTANGSSAMRRQLEANTTGSLNGVDVSTSCGDLCPETRANQQDAEVQCTACVVWEAAVQTSEALHLAPCEAPMRHDAAVQTCEETAVAAAEVNEAVVQTDVGDAASRIATPAVSSAQQQKASDELVAQLLDCENACRCALTEAALSCGIPALNEACTSVYNTAVAAAATTGDMHEQWVVYHQQQLQIRERMFDAVLSLLVSECSSRAQIAVAEQTMFFNSCAAFWSHQLREETRRLAAAHQDAMVALERESIETKCDLAKAQATIAKLELLVHTQRAEKLEALRRLASSGRSATGGHAGPSTSEILSQVDLNMPVHVRFARATEAVHKGATCLT